MTQHFSSNTAATSKPKQEWVCEGCGLSGNTEYDIDLGAFAVVHAIRLHHEILAGKYAPLCRFDIDQVRVRNPKRMDEYAWNRLVAEIERKCGRKAHSA